MLLSTMAALVWVQHCLSLEGHHSAHTLGSRLMKAPKAGVGEKAKWVLGTHEN